MINSEIHQNEKLDKTDASPVHNPRRLGLFNRR